MLLWTFGFPTTIIFSGCFSAVNVNCCVWYIRNRVQGTSPGLDQKSKHRHGHWLCCMFRRQAEISAEHTRAYSTRSRHPHATVVAAAAAAVVVAARSKETAANNERLLCQRLLLLLTLLLLLLTLLLLLLTLLLLLRLWLLWCRIGPRYKTDRIIVLNYTHVNQ